MSKTEREVIIVGAGLAGLAVSYYLARQDIPHLILEKSHRVGGIWSSMRWPGLRCDTEIQNYSYSFNPFISSQYLVSGETIEKYLYSTAKRFGMMERIRFDTRVERAQFCSRDARWTLMTNRGVFRTRFLVNANGYFDDRPYVPELVNRDAFAGEVEHLFDLHDVARLRNQRVLLVGSGASAISAAPAIAAAAESLTLLQRSPSYIYEQDNRIGLFADLAQRCYRKGYPMMLSVFNGLLQIKYDLLFVTFRVAPWVGRLFFRHHWRKSVSERTYVKHFTPSYNPWEQRIPVALGLRKLLETNAIDVVTGNIERFDRTGVRLTDGRRIEVDHCVFATGFNLKFFRFELAVDGRDVDTRRINFYKGMMMGGIPNYFQPFGPPHTSFTRRVETVSKLIVRILCHMHQRGLDTVSIPRRSIRQNPRITPGYIMRDLPRLPAFHGSLELPSIDNLLFYRFRPRCYRFGKIDERPSANAIVDMPQIDSDQPREWNYGS